jgi:hypothetical protein
VKPSFVFALEKAAWRKSIPQAVNFMNLIVEN